MDKFVQKMAIPRDIGILRRRRERLFFLEDELLGIKPIMRDKMRIIQLVTTRSILGERDLC